MFKINDKKKIKLQGNYVIAFFQMDSGLRLFYLCDLSEMSFVERQPGFFKFSEIISGDVLINKNIFDIPNSYSFIDGQAFDFDSHLIWFDVRELDSLMRGEAVNWVTPVPPILATH